MDLDTDWIEEYEKMEGEYNDFYKEQLESVNLFLVYVNRENEVFHIKNENILLEDGVLKKENLIYLIREHRIYNTKTFSPLSLLKYNISLDPEDVKKFIITPTKYDFITSERYINSIEWEDSISLFHDLNSLHIIFYEKSLSNKHNRTKKIYIQPSKSKTRRKYI